MMDELTRVEAAFRAAHLKATGTYPERPLTVEECQNLLTVINLMQQPKRRYPQWVPLVFVTLIAAVFFVTAFADWIDNI